MTLSEAATGYACHGWSVIPLRWTGDVENRKKPLLEEWGPYQEKPADEAQVLAWWARWPQANIGIVMGAVSGMVAVDLDGPNAIALLRKANVVVPRTAAVHTGKGHHAYYKHPGYAVSNRARLLSDGQGSAVDVRGDGGYVVAPPSVHGSGRVYQWVVPPEEGLAELSPTLAALIQRKTDRGPEELKDSGWVSQAMCGVPQGQRDDMCARLAGYWLALLDNRVDRVVDILRPYGHLCTPAFADSEVRKTVQSVARKEAARIAEEDSRGLPRIHVIEAPVWLGEVEAGDERCGIPVDAPGFGVIGGLVPGDLVVLAGRPGMGKSTMAAQVTVEMGIREQVPTYVVSTEMTRRQWGSWMAAYLSETTTAQLTRPLQERWRRAWLAAPLAVSDPGTISIREIRQLAENRLGLKLLIIDHIGRITGGRKESRVLEVGDVARGLKGLAKDLGCTVLALCQLNRRIEGADDREPRLSDLRESGEIEQEADSVMFLWTDERDQSQAEMPAYLTVAKNRHGATRKLQVLFDKPKRRIVQVVRV